MFIDKAIVANKLCGNLDWSYLTDVPTSFAPSDHASSLVTSLSGYSKATSASDIAATDTLNSALGKLEYKADSTYDLVKGAYDGDGTIENLAEILKVLDGIKDTDTIQAIVGKYLPLTGGTISNNYATPIAINNTTERSEAGLKFCLKNEAKGWVGYGNDLGTYLYTYTGPHYLRITEDGTPYCDYNVILHAKNYSTYLNNTYYTEIEIDNKLENYIPRQRILNPDTSTSEIGGIPFNVLALKSSGTPIYDDSEFKSGTNNV
jgi:hypothetical protein